MIVGGKIAFLHVFFQSCNLFNLFILQEIILFFCPRWSDATSRYGRFRFRWSCVRIIRGSSDLRAQIIPGDEWRWRLHWLQIRYEIVICYNIKPIQSELVLHVSFKETWCLWIHQPLSPLSLFTGDESGELEESTGSQQSTPTKAEQSHLIVWQVTTSHDWLTRQKLD